MIETGLALIATCLPTFYHVVVRFPFQTLIAGIQSFKSKVLPQTRSLPVANPPDRFQLSRSETGFSECSDSNSTEFEAHRSELGSSGAHDLESAGESPVMPSAPDQVHARAIDYSSV